MDTGKPWDIKANVTVKPTVKLGQYKGVTVPKQDVTVSHDDVNATYTKRRTQQATLVVKDDKAATNGHTVDIHYVGTLHGKTLHGGSSKLYSYTLGSNYFIPGFTTQLVGTKSGDTVTVNVTFPTHYKATDLAGKAATFKTTLTTVKVKTLPTLDEHFAKDLQQHVDNLAQLKDKIKLTYTDQRKTAAKLAVQTAALKLATELATITTVPNANITQTDTNQMDQYLGNMQRQGISPKMYYQYTGTTTTHHTKQFTADATTRVRTNLVLTALVKATHIQPTTHQDTTTVKLLASTYKLDTKAVRQDYSTHMLKHDIGVKTALTLLTHNAKEVTAAKDTTAHKAHSHKLSAK